MARYVLASKLPPRGREAQRRLHRLLRRHGSRILVLAIVVELENPRQAAALARHYGLHPMQLPPELFLQDWPRRP